MPNAERQPTLVRRGSTVRVRQRTFGPTGSCTATFTSTSSRRSAVTEASPSASGDPLHECRAHLCGRCPRGLPACFTDDVPELEPDPWAFELAIAGQEEPDGGQRPRVSGFPEGHVGYPCRRTVRCQVRPPSSVRNRALLSVPLRATAQATAGVAALTLMIEQGRVGSPCATTVRHCCPASAVTCTSGRLRPQTIHHKRALTTLAGQRRVIRPRGQDATVRTDRAHH